MRVIAMTLKISSIGGKCKIIVLFLVVLLLLLTFSNIGTGDSLHYPTWALTGAYVKYTETSNATSIYNNGSKIYSNPTSSIGVYRITSVDFKNQIFSYVESVTQPAVLVFFKPNATITNNFINITYNCTFSEFFNTTGNASQPITIFFINNNTINELNKGVVPNNLSYSLSLFNFAPDIHGNSAMAISNINLNIGNKIYPVDKIFVRFYLIGAENYTLALGNATAFVDDYSGIIVKWDINLIKPGFLGSPTSYENITLIINSTNIPMYPPQRLNLYSIILVPVSAIIIISIAIMVYKRYKGKNYRV